MKKILLIASLLISLAGVAQPRIWGTGGYKIRNNPFVFIGTSGTDSVGRIDSLQVRWNKPVRVGAYTTAGAPSAANYPGYIIINSDSAFKPQYSNGSAWLNLPGTAGSGGGGSADSTIFATLYRLDTAKANIRAAIPSVANAFVYDGNTKGAIPVFGTNDNFGLDFETNNVVRHRLQADGTFVFGGTTDVAQLVHINGDLRLSGTITCPTTSGFSMLPGASFSSFGATDVTNAFAFGYQNTLTNIGATRTLVNNTINVTTNGATTQTISGYKVLGTINNTAGTTTVDGFSVGWTLTSTTGTNVRSFTNDNGDNWFNRSAGNTGIGLNSAPSAKLHVSGSVRTDLGSDATGDIFYRSSGGNWARLGVGSNGDVLTLASGLPSWAAPGGGSDGNGIYSGSGSVSGTVNVSGGGSASLNLGTSGSKLAFLGANSSGSITLTASNYVQLFGGIQVSTQNAGDANFTASDNVGVIHLGQITANRDFTPPAQGDGKLIIIHNRNSSGNTWNVTGNMVTAAGVAVTSLANGTMYIFLSDGTNFVQVK